MLKGYLVSSGYMGYDPVLKRYFLYPTEQEYYEAMEEDDDDIR